MGPGDEAKSTVYMYMHTPHTHTHILTVSHTHTHTHTAPAAPGNLRILSSTSTTLTLTWLLPNPLNGILGAYQLQYGIETDFLNGIISTRLLFTTRYTVSGIQGNTVYRLQVRASTISLNGDTLWGPYSTLRVRNGQCM